MTINAVLFLALVGVLVIQFYYLPLLHEKIRGELGPAVIKPYALFHVLAALRTVALAILIGTMLVIATIWHYAQGAQATSAEVAALLGRLQHFRAVAIKVDIAYTLLALLGLSAALAWLTYKQAQQKAEKLFASIAEAERKRVFDALERGEWKDLPPNETMREIHAIYMSNEAHLQRARASGDTEGIAALMSAQEKMRMHYLAADATRRMNLHLNHSLDDDLVLPASSSWQDRLRHMLINRGVLKTLNGGSKIVAFVAMVTLVPASIGFNLALAADNLESRLVQLDALRVRLAATEVQSAFAAALQAPSSPSQEDDPGDDETEERIASGYDAYFNNHVVQRFIAAEPHAAFARTAVREAILRDYVDGANGEVVAGQRQSDDGLLVAARKKSRELLHRIRKQHEAQWAILKAAAPSGEDFGMPLHRRDVQRAMADRFVSAATADAGRELADAYGSHAYEFLTAFMKGGVSAKDAMDSAFKRNNAFWTQQADNDLHAIHQRLDPGGDLFNTAMRENPPTIHPPAPAAQVVEQAGEILGSMPGNARATDVLLTYQDIVPGQPGDELETAATTTTRRFRQPGVSQTAQPSTVAFSRAYDYDALHGFARVGGVLIGKMPEPSILMQAGPDIIDLAWHHGQASDLTMTLTSSRGDTHRFGPYPRSLVRQALTYAADQRPLAVTMIRAEPLFDQKVIVHPSLVDTALGCRTIQFDKLVNEATARNASITQAMASVRADDALYHLAWGTAIAAQLPALRESHPANTKRLEFFTYLEQKSRTVLADARLKLSSSRSPLASLFGKTVESPTTTRSEFYDARLVKMAHTCARSASAVQDIENCIRGIPMDQDGAQAVYEKLPELQFVNGVRESKYQIDARLDFLRPVKDQVLWPFDFVLLAPFSVKDWLNPGDFIDKTPFDFPSLHEQVLADVRKLISTDKKSAALFSDMRDFTIVQRLFRTALEGKLGNRFPLEKLTQLSYELKKQAVPLAGYRTETWEPSTSFDKDLVEAIKEQSAREPVKNPALAQLAAAFTQRIQACAGRRADRDHGPRSRPAEERQRCGYGDLSKKALAIEDDATLKKEVRMRAAGFRRFASILDLRTTLGVFAPENVDAKSCPAL